MSRSDPCSMPGCNVNQHARLLCTAHYYRLKRHGSPTYVSREYHGMHHTSEYYTWSAMKRRCYNLNDKSYPDYGGRGIKVCDSWRKSFITFYKDMGKRPNGLTLERIDNDGDYEPSNCKWATRTEQSQNQRVPKDCQFGIRGISKVGGKFRAKFWVNKRPTYLGTFSSLAEATRAMDKARKVDAYNE